METYFRKSVECKLLNPVEELGFIGYLESVKEVLVFLHEHFLKDIVLCGVELVPELLDGLLELGECPRPGSGDGVVVVGDVEDLAVVLGVGDDDGDVIAPVEGVFALENAIQEVDEVVKRGLVEFDLGLADQVLVLEDGQQDRVHVVVGVVVLEDREVGIRDRELALEALHEQLPEIEGVAQAVENQDDHPPRSALTITVPCVEFHAHQEILKIGDVEGRDHLLRRVRRQ